MIKYLNYITFKSTTESTKVIKIVKLVHLVLPQQAQPVHKRVIKVNISVGLGKYQ